MIELGNFSLCLNVKSISKSAQFYKTLGLKVIGGKQEQGWLILQHANCIIGLFEGHIQRNLLHFRGCDIFETEKKLMERGLTPSTRAHIEECEHGGDGTPSMEFIDPDSNVIYFNTAPDEPSVELNINNLPSGKPDERLGRFELCLACINLDESIYFYERLGFDLIDGNPKDEGWAILKHSNGIVALYAKSDGHMNKDMILNFRGGDVKVITSDLKKKGITFTKVYKAGKNGGGSATLEDPDCNEIFFDTAPVEPVYEFNIERI